MNPKKTNNTKPLTPQDTVKEVETLLKLPPELAHDRVLTWIRASLYLISPEQAIYAIENNVRVDQLLFQALHLNHPLVSPLARNLFRIFWQSVSFYLTDAWQLYSILAVKPEVKRVLDTEKGRRWLDQSILNGYTVLYNYCWSSFNARS